MTATEREAQKQRIAVVITSSLQIMITIKRCQVNRHTMGGTCVIAACQITCVLGMAFGFMVYDLMELPIFCRAALSSCHKVVLPLPLGPTMTTPIR